MRTFFSTKNWPNWQIKGVFRTGAVFSTQNPPKNKFFYNPFKNRFQVSYWILCTNPQVGEFQKACNYILLRISTAVLTVRSRRYDDISSPWLKATVFWSLAVQRAWSIFWWGSPTVFRISVRFLFFTLERMLFAMLFGGSPPTTPLKSRETTNMLVAVGIMLV